LDAARAPQPRVQENHRHGHTRPARGRACHEALPARQGRTVELKGDAMLKLVVVNLFRNPLRTFLTMASVTVALFLFCALGGILDTLQEAIKVGSESRLVTRNKISLVQWMPIAYRPRIAAVPGVRRVAVQNWFGGQDPNDAHGFFAQFAVDDAWYAVYAKDMEIVQASPSMAQATIP